MHNLVATDICTGWTEAVHLLAREQCLVVEGLEAIARQLPFQVLGIDSDNDSVFIDETLVQICAQRGIEFTRSRAFRKNDQAWVKQKNGSLVRRFTGQDRYSGRIAGQAMVHLYKSVRLHVNYVQPSFKLLEKPRDGAKVIKCYKPSGHTLRLGHAGRHYPCLDQRASRRIRHRSGSGGTAAFHKRRTGSNSNDVLTAALGNY